MGGGPRGGTAPVRVARSVVGLMIVGSLVLIGCAPSATQEAMSTPDPEPEPTPSAPPRQPPPEPEEEPQPEQPEEELDEDESECSIAGGGGGGGRGQRVSDPAPKGEQRQSDPGVRETARDNHQAEPWEDRPVVQLCFDVPPDRENVQGLEVVTFTPDQSTCEVVFRAWPNKPETARGGNALEVDAAMIDDEEVEPKLERAGAPEGSPGTLLRIPLEDCLDAGDEVEIALEFTLTLGPDTPERVGYGSRDLVAWFATAYPLLAWERGRGWATEPAVDLFGETTSSEAYELEVLEVIVPAEDEVLGTGRSQGTAPGREDGTTIHRFSAESVRDVAVTVGDLEVVEHEVSGVRLHVAAPRSLDTQYPLQEWAKDHEQALVRLMTHFGDFPYQDLWVSVLPSIPSGIEFPGTAYYGDVDLRGYPELVPHELAHMWFYGLVGNNQARDPWLDEAFAEYAETLVNGTHPTALLFEPPEPVRGRLGESMSWYADLEEPSLYSAGVYRAGGATLHRARQAVGPERWDELLREYVNQHAHRIVTPSDVADLLSDEPAALDILREAGALSP